MSFMQPVCVGVAKVDGDAEGEKVPAAHVVQVLSEVAAAADESYVPAAQVALWTMQPLAVLEPPCELVGAGL